MHYNIYKITVNNHFYYGQTDNMHRRMQKHLASLKRGDHHNNRMQNSFNKNNDFHYEILSTGLTKEEANDQEIFLIESTDNINVSKGGNSWSSRKRSEETKKKISKSLKLMYEKDPTYKIKMSATIKAIFHTKEYQDNWRKSMEKVWESNKKEIKAPKIYTPIEIYHPIKQVTKTITRNQYPQYSKYGWAKVVVPVGIEPTPCANLAPQCPL